MTYNVDRPRGVYAATLTPFTSELEPDRAAFLAHCRWLLKNGCDGLAPFGTTGEGVSMTGEQKTELIEALADDGAPMARIIPGTGVCALGDAVRIARVAASHNCEGVLCLPPYYYKNPSEDGLFAFFSELIQRVGDPALRLYLYNFPQMSATPVTLQLTARLIDAYPGAIAGIKDSSGDWSNTAAFIKEFAGLQVFSGSEKFLLDNLTAGGAGCISATTNVLAQPARDVYLAWEEDAKTAPTLQEKLSAARLKLQEFPMVAALKHIKSHIGRSPAWENMLPPWTPLSVDGKRQLERAVADIEHIGFKLL